MQASIVSSGMNQFVKQGSVVTGRRSEILNLRDADVQRKSQQVDGLGRLVHVYEYLNEGSTLYATTSYSYVNNNPVKYNDPTGHSLEESGICLDGDCSIYDPPPPPVPGGSSRTTETENRSKYNPFHYDTINVSIQGVVKDIIGLEYDINFYFNWNSFSTGLFTGEWGDFELLATISTTISIGFSGEVSGFISASGAHSSIDDIMGDPFSLIGNDGTPMNISGCVPQVAFWKVVRQVD